MKRKIIFFDYFCYLENETFPFGSNGDVYNTQNHWTLVSCTLSPPRQKVNYIDIPGVNGRINLTVGTEPVYENRTITATLECSEGTREDRRGYIDEMFIKLSGKTLGIVLPDDFPNPQKAMFGLVSIVENYNDLAHCSVTITADVNPWKQDNQLHDVEITDTSSESAYSNLSINNTGGRPLQLFFVPINRSDGEDDYLKVYFHGSVCALPKRQVFYLSDMIAPQGFNIPVGDTISINKFSGSAPGNDIYVESVGEWRLFIYYWREYL